MLTGLLIMLSLGALAYMSGFITYFIKKAGKPLPERFVMALFWPVIWAIALVGAMFGKWKLL
jgi:hypothetical protein